MLQTFRLVMKIRWPTFVAAIGVAFIASGCSSETTLAPPPLPPGEFVALKKQSKNQAEFRNAIKQKLNEGTASEPPPPLPTAQPPAKKKRG